MARKPVKLNPKLGERVKTVCSDHGITQKALGEMVSLSEKTISSMVCGHSSVTRETAEAIVKLFPDYRLEWLLGIDDIKTMCEIDILNDLQQKYDEKWDDIFKTGLRLLFLPFQ